MDNYRPFDTFGWLKHYSSLYQKLIRTAGVVLLSYVLSLIMMQPFAFSSSMLVQSGGGGSDYNICDFYNFLANSRAVRVLDPDVVLVDIEDFDRDEIATLIDAVNAAEPAVVGIDVTFIKPRADDEHLILSISDIENPVLAAIIRSGVFGRDTFTIAEQSYFADMVPQATTSIVSLPTKSKHGMVREFGLEFSIRDTIANEIANIPSFALACASIYNPDCMNTCRDRASTTEYINYPSREFRHLKYDDVVRRPELLKDKIVLVGAVNDPSDVHKTPIGADVAGVELHAYAIATILNNDYIYPLSNFMNWFIAFAICFAFMFLSFSIKIGYKGLVLRIVQLLLLYGIIRVGYYFFIEKNVVIDFSCTFLMITFGFFASDIYYGVATLCEDIKNKLSVRKSNKNNTPSK